jgi:hypothetical protein
VEKQKPMASEKKLKPIQYQMASTDPKIFTGLVHTLVYRPHEGFADYAIATLTIENGVVKKVELSDPYAAFEARAKLDMKNAYHLEDLRQHYPAGFQHV